MLDIQREEIDVCGLLWAGTASLLQHSNYYYINDDHEAWQGTGVPFVPFRKEQIMFNKAWKV